MLGLLSDYVFPSCPPTFGWYPNNAGDLSKFRNGPVSVEIEYHDGLVERKLKKAKTEKPAKVVKPKPTKKAKAVKKAKPVKKKITKTVKKDKVNTNLGRFV